MTDTSMTLCERCKAPLTDDEFQYGVCDGCVDVSALRAELRSTIAERDEARRLHGKLLLDCTAQLNAGTKALADARSIVELLTEEWSTSSHEAGMIARKYLAKNAAPV